MRFTRSSGDALAASPLLIPFGMVNAHIAGSLSPATRVAEKASAPPERRKNGVLRPDHSDRTAGRSEVVGADGQVRSRGAGMVQPPPVYFRLAIAE